MFEEKHAKRMHIKCWSFPKQMHLSGSGLYKMVSYFHLLMQLARRHVNPNPRIWTAATIRQTMPMIWPEESMKSTTVV